MDQQAPDPTNDGTQASEEGRGQVVLIPVSGNPSHPTQLPDTEKTQGKQNE